MRPLSVIDEVFAEVRREEHRKQIMVSQQHSFFPSEPAALVSNDAEIRRVLGGVSIINVPITLKSHVGSFMENLQIVYYFVYVAVMAKLPILVLLLLLLLRTRRSLRLNLTI